MRKFTGKMFGSAHGVRILFAAVVSIFVIMGLANRPFNKEFMGEDFKAVEARIVFVFNTGRGARARTKLDVEYV
jgi:hypothetical protein